MALAMFTPGPFVFCVAPLCWPHAEDCLHLQERGYEVG